MISLGWDLHVRNSYVTAINQETGETLTRKRIANRREDLLGFMDQFKGQRVRVVIEATTNTYPMVSLFRQLPEVEVKVVHPRKMRIIAESICKTDEIDSEVLAELGLGPYRLPESWIPGAEVHDLRCELRGRARLVAMRTELKNRIHGVLSGEGFFEHPQELFGKSGREWLKQVELTEGGRRRLERYLRLIDQLEEEIKQINNLLREHYSRQPLWEDDAKILMSIPGIGLLTALTILNELGDWRRFRSAQAAANYAGLVPWVDRSNEKSHYGHISKCGPRMLRWILSEAAQIAVRKVPRYQRMYERIGAKGGKNIAVIAVARKMLCTGWIMLKKRENFRYEEETQDGSRGRARSPYGLK